ncbi:hypothetical protein RFI_37626 [Reticulomyxa filosa]|uniref:Uncharacterized protein n=1 Tax=Reticulomyxa filosa TaxID=46433 RepID=X6LFE4_RETFI|nr:hypothetical protein RFI_37626 [Reticulomyxa filosa]|eukprot:ETN99841.1 hypothetical protein RFI_37626 [Reticulomyxa filosa]
MAEKFVLKNLFDCLGSTLPDARALVLGDVVSPHQLLTPRSASRRRALKRVTKRANAKGYEKITEEKKKEEEEEEEEEKEEEEEEEQEEDDENNESDEDEDEDEDKDEEIGKQGVLDEDVLAIRLLGSGFSIDY